MAGRGGVAPHAIAVLPATPALSFAARAVLLIAGAAWLISLALEVTGRAGALHHHALIEPGAPPLWVAVPLFLVAWQVMVGAMMLPASTRAVGVVTGSRFVARPGRALAGFLLAYALVWSAFGVAAFVGDMGLHALVHASPWLAARPWLIQAFVLALAGAWQLVPLRRRALEACRHPARRVGLAIGGNPADSGRVASRDFSAALRSGLAHGLDCLVASWAVMLLMFAAGVANLAWMAVLAAAMAYEALGRHGARFGIVLGFVLLDLAAIAATGVVLGF
jgi:predicted metal-binding membrane protein